MLQMNLWGIPGPCYMHDETVEHNEVINRK